MVSLRVKLTLALLVTSLASVALVSLVARGMVLKKFDRFAMEKSFQTFRSDAQAYLTAYGSWEQAERAEPFDRFMKRRHNARRERASSRERAGDGAASPENEAPSGGPPDGPDGGPRQPGGPPPGGGNDTSFRFILLDPQGKVLLGPPAMRGQAAPPDIRAQAEPIMVGGKVAALGVPIGRPNLSRQDREYLAAVQQALWRGVVLAGVLAVTLGLFFGNRLSAKLCELTNAIEAVGEGDLRQRVDVHARDEIGILADAFNRMSVDLAQTHEELHRSNAKISEQAAYLKELSIRDELTKLYNRRHFNEQTAKALAQAARYGHPLTVMVGDIDHFKRINDSFTHAVGDQVLRHMARLLQTQTRDSDIVARYGGEEFAIAFTETPLPQALALCERLRHMIEAQPWHQIHPELRVTMSMGLSDDIGLGSCEKLVAAADEKLYQAKNSGRNRVCADAGAAQAALPRA